tara:strand:+ start:218 stop:625 length:408 start_codon:yes stop_codon:yes gene_type:complete
MDISKINQLPDDLVGEIYKFIPSTLLLLTNKFNWKIHYSNKIKSRPLSSSYWRFLLRYDMDFIFSNYIDYYFPLFIKRKRVIYQDKIFPRKIELIKYLSTFVFESQKCKAILDNFMTKNRLVFKRIRTKSNKWTN